MNVILNGKEFEMDVVASYMDDEIREELHLALAPCEEQEFLDAYIKAHAKKFGGENFDIN